MPIQPPSLWVIIGTCYKFKSHKMFQNSLESLGRCSLGTKSLQYSSVYFLEKQTELKQPPSLYRQESQSATPESCSLLFPAVWNASRLSHPAAHSGKTQSLGWAAPWRHLQGCHFSCPQQRSGKEEGENKEHKQIQALRVTLSINLNLVSAYSKWVQPQNAALVKQLTYKIKVHAIEGSDGKGSCMISTPPAAPANIF